MSGGMASSLTNPFPGLRPFREDEEYLFFGRENQVDAMVDKLADTHFLAVVGTSGSGKSSLVNCGLRPALRQGLMARAGTAWRMAQFRPGNDPIGAMARALGRDGVLFRQPAAAGLVVGRDHRGNLRMSKLGLIDMFEQARLDEASTCWWWWISSKSCFATGSWRRPGAEATSASARKPPRSSTCCWRSSSRQACPIFVVLTMRSDFLGDCAQFPGLAEAINAGQYLVPRMTRDERRAAIDGPVGVAARRSHRCC